MVDEKSRKIKGSLDLPFYGSREAPDKPGVIKGKPRPPSDD